jgi:4-aminobutyrate aminotransferase/(S)-3-amino-2-methylpropionate transaminase
LMMEKRASRQVMNDYDKYVMHSFVKSVQPIVVAGAKGATVTDLDGKIYIDCFSGISVVNTGHCNPRVVEAVKQQAEKLIHCCTYLYYNTPATDLAKKLAEIAPEGLQKTFFCNSGAEAVETALKLGRRFTGKHEIIALMCSFHGRTLGTLSVTGQAGRKNYAMGPYLGDVAFAPAPYCYRCSLGLEYPACGLQCAKMVDDVVNYATSGNVAEFIAEPVLGEAGIVVPPPEYFSEVKKVLDQHEILFIADEVQTGFGRTGKMFAMEHYGVAPDMVAMAKGIADGLPLGACTTRADIGDAFQPGDHLSTFGGNPISCAAAMANIDYLLENRLPDEAGQKGEYLLRRLRELRAKHKLIGDIRGLGLMVGVELVKDQKMKTPAQNEATKIRELALSKGVLLGHGGVKGNTIRIQPPLVITEEQLENVVQVFDECLRDTH